MAYGTVKVDNITFDNNGSDQNVTVSGLYNSLTSGITVTGTISGAVVIGSTSVSGTTVAGVTVTGTTVQGVSGTFTSLTGTTIQGTTATYTTGSFTSLTGTTTTGTTANFVSGVFSTRVSGTTVIATTGTFTSLTGTTTQGTTATYTTGSFTSLTGTTTTGTTSSFTSGVFTTLSGATATFTSGIIASGTAAAPSLAILGDPDTGVFSPGANQLAVATNGTQRLTVDTAATTSTLPVVHPLGAVGTPSITFTGDLNTGFYSPGADTLAAVTAGNNRLNITSAGLVGIGTSSPGAGLHVNSAGQTTAALDTAGNLNVIISDSSASVNAGGSLVFAAFAGAWRFASIKGLVENGSGNTLGDIAFSTRNTTSDATLTERLRITSGGLVGIGAASPGSALEINAAAATAPFIAKINTAEAARIDSSGRLLVGTSTSRSNWANTTGTDPNFQIEVNGNARASISRTSANEFGPQFWFGKTRGTAYEVLSNNDQLGEISFMGADGSELVSAASITAAVDGTPGTNDMPGRLVFSTTEDGASSPTERFRIRANGLSSFFNTGFVIPETDNATNLGGATNRWSAVYAVNGTIQTSDERAKTDITNATLGSDFVKALRPVSYKWIEGGQRHTGDYDKNNNFIYESVPGSRTHWGFIAQEVKEAVDVAGVDFGGWVLTDKDDPDSQQALRYDQFIAPLTKALQEALTKIEQLEQRLADAGI